MVFKEDNTFNNICEKSLMQWLDEMEKHEDVAVRCGVKLARDYITGLKHQNINLQEQGKLKDEYLRKLKTDIEKGKNNENY